MLAAAGVSSLRAVGSRKAAVRGTRTVTCMAAKKSFDEDWLNKNPIVPALAFIGWTVPSNIPVPAFGGKSLFAAFTGSIGAELAHFPTGPSIDSPFWLYMVTWHVGLFLALLWGQIGVNGRNQGYF